MNTKRITALLASIALIIGAPLALWMWGSLDAFVNLGLRDWLLRPLTSGSLVALLTAAGWLAWATVLVSFVGELIELASRGKHKVRIPGARWCRPLVVVLLAAVVGAANVSGPTVTPGATSGAPSALPMGGVAMDASVMVATPLESSDVAEESAITPPVVAPIATEYEVQTGDDLWTLALTTLGDGSRWSEIAALNPTLAADPLGDLVPGTVLILPDAPLGSAAEADAGVPVDSLSPEAASSTDITVVQGDTLWDLSETHLEDPFRWPELYEANSQQISDPDVIEIGMQLVLPETGTTPVDTVESTPDEAPAPPVEEPSEPGEEVPGVPGEEVPGDTADGGGEMNQTEQSGETQQDDSQPGETADDLDTGTDASAVDGLIGPIGAGVAAALAGVFLARRKRQLDQRPVGKALPALVDELTSMEQALDARGTTATPSHAPHSEASVYVTIGSDPLGQNIEFDLAAAGIVEIVGEPTLTSGLLVGIAAQFVGDGVPVVDVTFVGTQADWLRDLDDSRLTVISDPEQAMRNLHALLRFRIESNEETPFVPAVFLFEQPPAEKIPSWLATAGVSVVVAQESAGTSGDHSINIRGEREAVLTSGGVAMPFQPNLATPDVRSSLQMLTAQLNCTDYIPAAWWNEEDTTAMTELRHGSTYEPLPPILAATGMVDETVSGREDLFGNRPHLLVLGPVVLAGARGEVPARAARQCAEYCAWIMRNPGSTSTRMTQDLLVAEGTRRSNMSRLRTWLGTTNEGDPYLPDAYSGRIELHEQISSDWERFQLFIAGGINLATDSALHAALSLVRGAPLADAVPGSWRWAEQWRVEMVSQVRDAAAELFDRALDQQDFVLARWAVERGAIAVGEDDEALMCRRVRLEQACGNRQELDRLVLQITRRARQLGEDLSDTMVDVLRSVVETGITV